MKGLTAFIIDMLKGELSSSDPELLARDYAIQTHHAAGMLRLHQGGSPMSPVTNEGAGR